MDTTTRIGLSTLFVLSTAFACSDDGGDLFDDATGGGSGSAGAGTTSGGTAGANTATGGAPSAGTSSGNVGGSGGMTAPNAGNGSVAGASNGGTNASGGTGGNAAGTGGTSSAGMSNAGSGATSNAGAAGSGTSGTGGSGGATPSTGCGNMNYPPGQTNTLTVDEVEREFIVAIPEEYDATGPHRLVFAFHGRTGTAEQIAGRGFAYYGIQANLGDSTIFVAPQGLGTEEDPEDTGWPNSDGRDIDFVRAMLDWLNSNYCIDQTRIFSAGMSYGGIMSNTIGCEMADVFRGIAPIAGALFGRGGCSGPPIAAWMTHGTEDDIVTYEQGENARDAFLEKNGCDAADPTPVEPEGCVSYQGCEPGHPVVWCEHDGGHTIPSFSGDAISDFFSQF